MDYRVAARDTRFGKFRRVRLLALAVGFVATIVGPVEAQLYINEIFFDPPGSGDSTQEYVELRGPAVPGGYSLDNYYLIFLENEFNSQQNDLLSGPPGVVDFMFDLNGKSLSPDGFLTLRQKGTPYTLPADAYNLINSGSADSWGTEPANNTLGVSSTSGKIENSGFTAMLINKGTGPAPTLGMALDGNVDNDGDLDPNDYDGLDYATGQPGWTIHDSIGIFSEVTEAVFGRTYAPTTFGPEVDGEFVDYIENTTGLHIQQTFHPNITDDQTYVGTGFEIEMVARWGDSTGDGPGDWHVTNLTDKALSGFVSAADGFRQSGHIHDDPLDDFVETNQFVPYGANLTNTLGAANYPLNLTQLPWDYNHDGVVDAADYTVWRDTLGSTTDLRADGNGSNTIDEDDFAFWRARFGYEVGSVPGQGAGSGSAAAAAVPEPASIVLLSLAGVALVCVGRCRRS